MPPAEHRAFIDALIGGARVGDSLARTLYEATEGNPFFTRELVRSLIDSGGIAEDDMGTLSLSSEMGLSSDALPETIHQVVEKQIERLDAGEREVLSMAAVLGRTFEYRDLEALAEGSSLDALFVGKLALDHIPLIQDLLDREVLHAPWIRPRWLDVPGAQERLDRLRAGASVTDLYEGEGSA